MPLPTDAPTIERIDHAEGHADTSGVERHRGAASGEAGEAGAEDDLFGGYDAAADFAPEGGPRVFREYRPADASEGTGSANPSESPGPQAPEGDAFAFNADGTPRYNKDGSRTKKRGRRAGSAQGPRQAPPVRVNAIEAVLLSTHGLLAAATRFEDLALEEKEAKELAKAIAAVSAFYPYELDPKAAAWIGLGMVAAPIYGPRAWLAFKAWQEAKAQAARNARRPAPVPMRQPDPPGPGKPTPPAPTDGGQGFPAFVPDRAR